MRPAIPEPGGSLGSYEIEDEVGRGGLGVVFRAQHRHLGRRVALKVLHPYWTSSPEFVTRFREEGRLMARLDHSNILRVYDAGEDAGVFYLAMALLDGKVLETLMGSPLPVDVVLHVGRQLARALEYAHDCGVVHRDVKPGNIMVSPQGQVTLMDFGVARLKDSPGLTMPGVRVGTPYYMAPEQVLGRRTDARVDLYALGVVLYQLLSGGLPFPGPNTEEVYEGHVNQLPPPLGAEAPSWLRRVVRKLLSKSPEDRFETAGHLLRALESRGDERILTDLGVETAQEWNQEAEDAGASTAAHPPIVSGPARQSLTREDRTALSLDVVGSSAMKNPGLTLAAQEQFSLFRDYVRRRLEQQGVLDSLWSGDGLIALFTSPACGALAARAILDGLASFNAAGQSHWAPMRIRIGVHHGPLLMAPGQPLGEVTSRTLDLAGHLQKISPENSVLISESIYFALPDPAGWKPAGDEYLLVFPFRLFNYSVTQADKASTDALLQPAPLIGRSSVSMDLDLPLDLRLAQAVAQEPGMLRLEVATRRRRSEYEVRDEAILGRRDSSGSAGPHIEIDQDDAVSRRHARFFRQGSGFFVEDLESANGTCLNGTWLQAGKPAPLHEGDVIELGELSVVRVISLGRAPGRSG